MVGAYIGAVLLCLIGLIGIAFSLAAYGSLGRLFGLSLARTIKRHSGGH